MLRGSRPTPGAPAPANRPRRRPARRPPGPGPFFAVDDVEAFYAANQGKLSFNFAPRDIAPGRYVSFDDPSGNRIHVLDMSAERPEDQAG